MSNLLMILIKLIKNVAWTSSNMGDQIDGQTMFDETLNISSLWQQSGQGWITVYEC